MRSIGVTHGECRKQWKANHHAKRHNRQLFELRKRRSLLLRDEQQWQSKARSDNDSTQADEDGIKFFYSDTRRRQGEAENQHADQAKDEALGFM